MVRDSKDSSSCQGFVTAVAKGWVLRVLAVAQPNLLFFRQRKLLRAKAGTLVGTIAQRLVSAQATGTPPVITGF